MAGPARGTAFTDSALLLQAVLAGHGAGLLPAAMVQPDVAAGRLVTVGPAVLPGDFAYYLVYPEEHLQRPSVAAFRAWALGEAGRYCEISRVGAPAACPGTDPAPFAGAGSVPI